MSVNTRGAWSSTTVNGVLVATCTSAVVTAETYYDVSTLKTPTTLNPRKPWTLFYQASDTPDGQALPMDIFVGFAGDFSVTANNDAAATSGGFFKQVHSDVVLFITASNLWLPILFDPDLGVDDVVTAGLTTGFKCKIPVAPYYAFNLNGGSVLPARSHYFKIVQAQ